MKVTKETPMDQYPYTKICGSHGLTAILSNGLEIQVQYRATLYAYIQRGYYKHDDIVERAYIAE